MMFRPKIICFVCNWSLPAGVDVSSPPAIHAYPKLNMVQVVCVGRVDPAVVLETFAKGADGVLLIGCHPPDCHYVHGNLQAERKVKMLKKLLSQTGLEQGRLRLDWGHAYETERFPKIIDDFRNLIIALGPSPLIGEKVDSNTLLNIKAAKAAAEDFRLRVLVGRERELTEKENMFGERIAQQEFDVLLHEVVETEFIRYKIHLLIKEGPMSVKEIAAIANMKPTLVLRHIVNMRRKGMVALDHIEKTTLLYKALEVQ